MQKCDVLTYNSHHDYKVQSVQNPFLISLGREFYQTLSKGLITVGKKAWDSLQTKSLTVKLESHLESKQRGSDSVLDEDNLAFLYGPLS